MRRNTLYIITIAVLGVFTFTLNAPVCMADPENKKNIPPIKQIIFDAAAEEGIDPYVLFAVAVAESQKKLNATRFTVWPWTLNVAGKAHYFPSQDKASDYIKSSLENGIKPTLIDIGMFQINLYYVQDIKAENPKIQNISDDALIDVKNNTVVASLFLSEALRSARNDLALGIGHYHSHRPVVARQYGLTVLSISNQLKKLNFYGGEKWKKRRREVGK